MRVKIEDAAKKLDLPPQALREWIKRGTCSFGEIVHDKKSRNGRRTYYINSERLERYLKGE